MSMSIEVSKDDDHRNVHVYRTDDEHSDVHVYRSK